MLDWMAMLPGLAVAGLGMVLSYWWFNVHQRRKLEVAAGIQALSGMKWRECAGLVMEALARQGYAEEMSSRQPGDGGTEFLLRRGDESVLMSYKHGTAYRLGDSNIREFANAIQLCGASSGLLITLGSVERVALDLARRYDMKLFDGGDVWPLVKNLVPESLHDSIRQQATARNRANVLAGCIASVLIGAVVAYARMESKPAIDNSVAVASPDRSESASAPATAPQTEAAAAPSKPATTPSLRPAGDSNASIQAANAALAEIAKLSEAELALRRADAAGKIAGISQVNSATWSTQSTLVLSLAHSDGKDVALVTEACDMLSRYEELRYMRLQLEPPPGSNYRVRWRMCQ